MPLAVASDGDKEGSQMISNLFPSWLSSRDDFQSYIHSSSDESMIYMIEATLRLPQEERKPSELQLLLKWFQKNKILTHVHPKRLLDISRCIHLLDCPYGTDIVTQGEIGDAFYIILSGSVDVKINGTVVVTMASGMSFGEKALDNDCPRAATVTSLQQCILMIISASEYKTLAASAQLKVNCKNINFLYNNCSTYFKHFSHARLSNIVKIMATGMFEDKSFVVKQDTLSRGMCILYEGVIQITRKVLQSNSKGINSKCNGNSYGQSPIFVMVPIVKLEAGSLFGDDCLRRSDGVAQYNAVAVGKVKVLYVNATDIKNLIKDKHLDTFLQLTEYLHAQSDNEVLDNYLNKSKKADMFRSLKESACGEKYLKRSRMAHRLM